MSIHDKLKRVRKPRVHITYDVETEGAAVKKELPFVVGVMGDFSGDNTEEVENIRDAKDDVVYVTLDNISAYKGTELKFKDPEDTSKSGEYIFPDKTSAGAVLIFIKNKQGTYHFLHQIDEYAWKEFKNSGNYWTVLKGFT